MLNALDLIAVILWIEGVQGYLSDPGSGEGLIALPITDVLFVWLGFLLVTWLMNELATRDCEWRTRFGRYPSGYTARTHAMLVYSWGMRAAKLGSVVLFGIIIWQVQWPQYISNWPTWIGLSSKATLGHLKLADSEFDGFLLSIFPYLMALLVSWLPRRRLVSGIRNRKIPLLAFLDFEARLTCAPILFIFGLSFISDLIKMLPEQMTAWVAKLPGANVLLPLGTSFLLMFIAFPAAVVWLWRCQPLPDNELRARLVALMQRSGIKARAILTWGSNGTGLLNACVIGPWSRYRYVLISPQLVNELSLEETEAVMAHELGHARHGHLTLLVVMLMCLSILIDHLTQAFPKDFPPLAMCGIIIAFAIFYIWAFFGSVMRQCEREADLASAEMMGSPAPLVSSLEKLAYITGNIRNVWSWHHGSIADRVTSVQDLSMDPEKSRRFHGRLRYFRIALIAITLLAIVAELKTRMT